MGYTFHGVADSFPEPSLFRFFVTSEFVEFFRLDHYREMDEVIFVRMSLVRIEDAIGATVSEVVLVWTEKLSRARTFACKVLITFSDVACNPAAAGAAASGQNVKEDAHDELFLRRK
jgi:hypothetical protein